MSVHRTHRECSKVGMYGGAHVECSFAGRVLWSTRGMFLYWACILERTWNVFISAVYAGAHVTVLISSVYTGVYVECSYVGRVLWSTRGIFLYLVCTLEHTWNVHILGVYSGAHVECSYIWCVHWSISGMFLCWACILEHTWNILISGVYAGAYMECSNFGRVLWSTRGMFLYLI